MDERHIDESRVSQAMTRTVEQNLIPGELLYPWMVLTQEECLQTRLHGPGRTEHPTLRSLAGTL